MTCAHSSSLIIGGGRMKEVVARHARVVHEDIDGAPIAVGRPFQAGP